MPSQSPAEPFTPINEVGEFGLIGRLKDLLGTPADTRISVGIDDDAAVYEIATGQVHVITTDGLVEGIHFDRTFVSMAHLGNKALSVNVSDIVAMNAVPLYATVFVGIPHNVSVEMMESLYEGMKAAAGAYGVHIVGGDTSAASRLTVSITVIGEAGSDEIVLRKGARVGDLICVSGNVGSAYAGLKVLLDEKKAFEEHGGRFQPQLDAFRYVVQRQLAPRARLDLVSRWRETGIIPNALIDISDGLASEVHHICAASNCGASINAPSIPIDLETRTVADRFAEEVDTYALFGGEDYELLFTIPEESLASFDDKEISVVGRITPPAEGITISVEGDRRVRLDRTGYQHFR